MMIWSLAGIRVMSDSACCTALTLQSIQCTVARSDSRLIMELANLHTERMLQDDLAAYDLTTACNSWRLGLQLLQ